MIFCTYCIIQQQLDVDVLDFQFDFLYFGYSFGHISNNWAIFSIFWSLWRVQWGQVGVTWRIRTSQGNLGLHMGCSGASRGAPSVTGCSMRHGVFCLTEYSGASRGARGVTGCSGRHGVLGGIMGCSEASRRILGSYGERKGMTGSDWL